MNKYQKYKLLVTWNVSYYGECRCCDYNEEETKEIELPRWLRLKKSDVDNDGTFFSVEKLKDLDDDESSWKTYTIIKAQLIRKLTIKEELSESSDEN